MSNKIAPAPAFPGITPPSSDFQAVRDGRRSMPFELVLDLSTARSIAAGTAAIIGVAGNSFYADPLIDASGNPIGGLVVARFEDVTLNPGGSRFTIAPQFIAKIPFTRILLENPAQPGKFARILYGTDIDFTPGINAQVTIAGTVAVAEQGFSYGAAFSSLTALAAGSNEVVVLPAANVNGIVVHDCEIFGFSNANTVLTNLVAKAGAAPASMIDSDVIVTGVQTFATAAGYASAPTGRLGRPARIAAGKGLYFRAQGLEANAFRKVLYTVL